MKPKFEIAVMCLCCICGFILIYAGLKAKVPLDILLIPLGLAIVFLAISWLNTSRIKNRKKSE